MDDWPEVAPADWNDLVDAFLDGIAKLTEIMEERTELDRPILKDVKAWQILLNHPLHNAYHLGQIVLLRRQQVGALLGVLAALLGIDNRHQLQAAAHLLSTLRDGYAIQRPSRGIMSNHRRIRVQRLWFAPTSPAN